MIPLAFVWPWALLFWAVFLWAFIPEFAIVRRARRAVMNSESRDRGSLRVISVGMGAAIWGGFALAFIRQTRFPAAWNAPAFVIGTAILAAGSLLRRHCWRVLGQWFTGDVQADARQPVIDRGAYRLVRHPSYTAGMLMCIGIGVALGSWLSTLVLAIVPYAVYAYRVSIEERALLETIGEPYAAYMRSRRKFVPFLF